MDCRIKPGNDSLLLSQADWENLERCRDQTVDVARPSLRRSGWSDSSRR